MPPPPPMPIQVLIADDSPFAAQYLVALFGSDPAFRVAGVAKSGNEAVNMAQGLRPDIVCMDVNMPGGDGYSATRAIMASTPVPVVIVSSDTDQDHVTFSFKALEAGALTFVAKPPGPTSPGHARAVKDFLATFKAMAGVKVIRRTHAGSPAGSLADAPGYAGISATTNFGPNTSRNVRIVAIAASTGGPQILQTILQNLPRLIAVPIVIVQHITPGFERGLADWLGKTCDLPIGIAVDGEPLCAGKVYIAPDGLHMEVSRSLRALLVSGPPEHGVKPAGSRLLRSVAKGFGVDAIGVVLSGMGRDGADGLKLMRNAGALTIAQDADSSVVHGMPGEAIRLGAACHVLDPLGIARMIVSET